MYCGHVHKISNCSLYVLPENGAMLLALSCTSSIISPDCNTGILSLQSLPRYGLFHTMDKFVLLEGPLSTRVWWRCSVVDSGELCVMTHLVKMMPILFADSWDTTVRLTMIISQCETLIVYCTFLYKQRSANIRGCDHCMSVCSPCTSNSVHSVAALACSSCSRYSYGSHGTHILYVV